MHHEVVSGPCQGETPTSAKRLRLPRRSSAFRRAGVVKGPVLYHYGSRGRLLRTCLGDAYHVLSLALLDLSDDAGPAG